MAKIPTSACPRCGSEQKFVRRLRPILDDISVVYIKCNMCRFETTVGYSAPHFDDIKKQRALCGAQGQREIDAHGQMTVSTARLRDRLFKEFMAELSSITKRIKDADIQTA